MTIRTRFFRKPVLTAIWFLLVTAMALLMGVGGSLMYSANALSGIMDEYHTSIAVRTDQAQWESQSSWGTVLDAEDKFFYQSDVDWFSSLDSVEEVYFHTVSAAHSSGLAPVMSPATYSESNESYNQVMLVAKIKEIIAVRPNEYDTQFFCLLEVEEFLSQCQNFTHWTEDVGKELACLIYLDGQEAVDYMEEGGRYIICGTYDPITIVRHYGDDIILPQLPMLEPSLNCVFQFGGLEVPQDDSEFGRTPILKRLEGSVEEFMADPDNANWAKQLEIMNRQHQSVPVMGTEALETFHAFVTYNANMTQGRFFTQEEYDIGAKVCILSEELAESSGIGLGDTITLSQYLCHDPWSLGNTNKSIRYISVDGRLNNPTIGLYVERSYGPEETFTVVGLYRLKNAWGDSSYAFTPNTVFIPQKAQIEGAFGGMTPGDDSTTGLKPAGTYGIYFTMKLKNGAVEDFETLMEGTSWAGQFLTVSQGSDTVQKTLSSIAGSTRTLFVAVLAGWVLLAALFVLLYQGMERRNLGIMSSLGATRKQTRRYLWGSGMVVCALGIAIGTAATGFTMDLVQSKLLDASFGIEANRYSVAELSEDAVSTMITQSQLPLWVIVALGAVQLLLLAGILFLQARSMSRKSPRKLLGK